MRLLGSVLIILGIVAGNARGAVTTIALSGGTVPGVLNAQFDTFSLVSINATGQGVFSATLTPGLGGVTVDNDTVLFKLDNNGLALLTREGVGSVPAVAGTTYQSFTTVAIDDQGDALVRGSLAHTGGVTASNNQGLWRFSTNGDALVARTGSQGVPGVASASFDTLPNIVTYSGDGRTAFDTTLVQTGDVTPLNDRGLWSFQATSTLLSREGVAVVPGVPVAKFSTFVESTLNNNNQVVTTAVLDMSAGVTINNRNGIWRFSDTTGTLIARTGQSNAPGLGGISFSSFGNPVINNAGQIAFSASGTTANTNGLWLYTNDVGELLARGGVGVVPDVPSANFEVFSEPVLSDTGHVLFGATLLVGTGDVTTANDKGLWIMDNSDDDHLLLRSGSGNVAGIPNANFLQFDDYAINEVGIVAVAATLETGPGGVTPGNDTGLWLVDPEGSQTLIAREGDTLAGGTIESLQFTSDSGGSDGRATGLNSLNQLLFQATFTNGDSGVFLYTPSTTTYAPADFNEDGYVDGTDLASWQGAYNTTSAADADGDGDSDGTDFLSWQRQYTGPAPQVAPLVVPEPSVWCLIAAAGCFSQSRSARRARRCR
ncbi:MAG: hypothetical protein SH868_15420 [Bythopirellula sp.]|nr:hypothetical protein [Bythopirellula sp.]